MAAKPVIHVGFDNSWRDTGALEWALQEARLRHEPLRAVHVIDDSLRRTAYWEPSQVDDAAMELIEGVRQQLAADGAGLDHEADLLVGPPAVKLAQTAEGSTMLVVGRRGMGTFKRLLIGSTSEAVVHQATVPVVVVPDAWKPGDHAGPIVIALDESDGQQPAIDFAVTAAAERNVPMRIVHVWDLPNIYSWDAGVAAGIDEELAENARRRWDTVAEEWRQKYPALDIEVDVRRDHAVDGVVTAAQDSDAQLLVVGGRRHHRATSMLLGSVARGVLHHATCPVVVVHAS
jgi:nucleotide-binding universal stress UspA family protein